MIRNRGNEEKEASLVVREPCHGHVHYKQRFSSTALWCHLMFVTSSIG